MQRQRRSHTRMDDMVGRHEQPTVKEHILKFEGATWRPPTQQTQTKHAKKVRKAFPFKTSLVQQQIRKFEGQTEDQGKNVKAGESSVGDPVRVQTRKSMKPKKIAKPRYSPPKVYPDDLENKSILRNERTCATVRKHIQKFEELASPRTSRSGEFVYDTEEIKDQPIALIRERFSGNEKLKYLPTFRSDENLARWKQYASEHEARVKQHIRKFEKLNIQQMLASEQAKYPRTHAVNTVPHKTNKTERKKEHTDTTPNAAIRNVRKQKTEMRPDTPLVIPADTLSGKDHPFSILGRWSSDRDRLNIEKGRLSADLDRSRSQKPRPRPGNDRSGVSLHRLPKASTQDFTTTMKATVDNTTTHRQRRSITKTLEKHGNDRKLHIPKININIRKFEKLSIVQVGDTTERIAEEEMDKHRSLVEEKVMKFEILNLNLD